MPTKPTTAPAYKDVMTFEVGKFYRHATGDMMAVRGSIETTAYGPAMVAEGLDGELHSVGGTETNTVGWVEVTEDDWLRGWGINPKTGVQGKTP